MTSICPFNFVFNIASKSVHCRIQEALFKFPNKPNFNILIKFIFSTHFTFHDLIHDLARMVSFKESLSTNGTQPRQISPNIRHLSIFHNTEKAEPIEAIVRALTCLDGENLSTIIDWDELPSGIFQCVSDLLKETKYLRALRLNLFSPVQPYNFDIQNFVSLRYLRLSFREYLVYNIHDNTRVMIPSEICRLYHLEVLELESGRFLEELPNNFNDLVSLRHFNVEGKLHSKIQGVGKLASLQELNNFDVQQKKGFEIEQLGSLKEIGGFLHIWNLENVKSKSEARKAGLAEKEKLTTLYLEWSHGELENESVIEGLKPNTNLKSLYIVGYGGVATPTWLAPSLIFLESLTLENCKAWEVLPPIGELIFLKSLKLSGMILREIDTRQSINFPSLIELEIIQMAYLEKWVWSDQFQLCPCLSTLIIKDCPKLEDLPLSGCATYEVLERFPSLMLLEITDCPLIFQLPPLPYSSLLSSISIKTTGFIESMTYLRDWKYLMLIQDQSLSFNGGEPLAFHKLSSLHKLEISYISNLESLNLQSFVALEKLYIMGCHSLTSLTFGEHLVSLKVLEIISCKTLISMKGIKSWVNLDYLHFCECPGFSAAWDSASKEIERTDPDFSLSLRAIDGDSLSLLTLPICKQLTSLRTFELEFSAFSEEHEVSLQLLTSIDLVDIEGCNNLQSFPFDLFPSLKKLSIKFPRIQSLSTNSCTEITTECKKFRNIKEVYINRYGTLQVILQYSTMA